MRLIPTALQSQLDSGAIGKTDMILFDFPAPTGLRGFFSGVGEVVFSGVTYKGAGSLFAIGAVGGSLDGAAAGLTVTLNADARASLEPTDLAAIETIQYRGRPVTIYRRYHHPESYAEIAVERLWRGYIDTIDHHIDGGACYLAARCESRALDLARSGYRMRTDADQRLVDPADTFFKDVGIVAKKEIQWANFTPEVPQKRKKLFGLF
jgi:hypothetical protein